jgi:ADP-heptose:LPS heptosyltransferase
MLLGTKPPLSGEALGRIVLVQLGRLGDVVASRIALHSIGAAYPGASVEVVVPWDSAPLFERGEPVSAIHAYQAGALRATASLLMALRRPRADLILDLTGTPRSRWLCIGSGARRRAGWGRRWLYSHGTDDLRRRSASYSAEIGRLLESLGIPARLDPPPLAVPPAPPELSRILRAFDSCPPVVLHPGASNPIRHWRGRRFARLAERLYEVDAPALLIAGPGEAELAADLAAACRVPLPSFVARDVCGLAAALAAARLFIGLDSGPMHLACALGVPSLALFGPNVPSRAAPLSGRLSVLEVQLPCRPCSQVLAKCVLPEYNCMDRIEVEAVALRATELLALNASEV